MTSLYVLAGASSQFGGIAGFLPFLGIAVIFYFLLIRPQQKRAKEHKAMLLALKKGDVVISQGGMIGKIIKVEDMEVTLEIAEGVRIKLIKSMILNLKTPPQANLSGEKPGGSSKKTG